MFLPKLIFVLAKTLHLLFSGTFLVDHFGFLPFHGEAMTEVLLCMNSIGPPGPLGTFLSSLLLFDPAQWEITVSSTLVPRVGLWLGGSRTVARSGYITPPGYSHSLPLPFSLRLHSLSLPLARLLLALTLSPSPFSPSPNLIFRHG